MGLAILVVGLVVFLGAHVFVTCRAQRAAVIARIGEWPYKGLFSLVSLVGLILIGYGFARLSRHRLDRRLVSAALDLLRHAAPDVAGQHLRGRGLYPRRHQARAQASDAGRREDLGGGASASRTAISARSSCSARFLAWAVYDRITLKRRSDPGAPPIPVGGRRQRHDRDRGRHRCSIWRSASCSIRW